MTIHMKDPQTMAPAEVVAELGELRGKVGAALKEMGPDFDASKITVFEGDTAAKAAFIQDANDRLDALGRRHDQIKAAEKAGAALERFSGSAGGGFAPDGEPAPGTGEAKSLGQRIAESEAWGKGSRDAVIDLPHAEVKTNFLTSGGWAPEVVRTGRVVPYATQAPRLIDLVPVLPTTRAAVTYMEETTYTNNAIEKAEAATAGEAALALTERSVSVRRISVFLPVSDEQLADVAEAAAYLNSRLPFMLRQRLDSQLIAGDGNAPNIEGFLAQSGLQTQALGADPVFDAIFKAITKIEAVGFAEADGIAANPNDWQDIRLTRTVDGIYILGNPDATADKRLFGLPVVTSTYMTENTILVGAFQTYSALHMRQDVEIKVSDSHDTNFTKGIQTLRATMRAALVVYRDAAFCEVTGV